MAKRLSVIAVLTAAAALAASAGMVSALPNTNGGNQADYCRRHCSPIAVASQRDSCEAACIRRGGPINIFCLPGAGDGCGEVHHWRVATRPPHPGPPPVTRGYRSFH